MTSPKFDRLNRLATIAPDDDRIDPELEDVVIPMNRVKISAEVAATRLPIAEVLQREVERTWDRYQSACRDLQLWRLSHGEDLDR